MIEQFVILFLRAFTALLPKRVILREGRRYMVRSFITGCDGEQSAYWPLSKLRPRFIHRFLGIDDDRMHNHPYEWSYARILAGGYVELRIDPGVIGSHATSKVYGPGDVNHLRANTFHRIIAADAWTLFIAGPKVQEWGFLDKGRYVKASGGQ